MGTNFHTAWIDDTTRFKAADMNAPLSGLDRGITYLKNIIAAYEGALSYSGGTLTWSDTIHIYFNTAAGLAVHNSIAAGSIALTDGQFAYVTLSETNNAALTVSAASISTGSASNYLAYNVLVLAYRDTESDNLFIVNLKKSFDQEMKPTDSPTLAALTLSGLTASLPVFSDASKKLETKTASDAFTAIKQAASTSATGVVELATDAEALIGTDTARAIVPSTLKYVLDRYQPRENLIGIAGQAGFGVGICPLADLPSGMTPMAGYDVLGDDNYGNYQFTDGSIMCWIPKFYYRIAHASNPTYATYGVNSVDIKGIDTYATTTDANAAGYALHRAFIDGGAEKSGCFVDKYKCSKVANGAGYTAASIANGLPLSSAADHNPFSDCTGGANYYYSAIDLAHRRDGVDGAVNASSIFFCCSQFIHAALAMLSLAHGQVATSTVNCAWYDATYNYPKGCNKNTAPSSGTISPADNDDAVLAYTSDGYSNCGKTGSGIPFAKTTHNGQNCGVADINGLVYDISIGITCIATSPAIEAMTQANPCKITITEHGKSNGDFVQINSITQADWSGSKDKIWAITKVNDNEFTINFDSSGFGTAYDAGTDPGTVTLGIFYVAKEATAMKDFTNGVAGATDHWGATGVAAMMDTLTPPFKSENAFTMWYGSGSNQVLAEDTSGNDWVLTGLGFPLAGSGVDSTGINLFGKDYFYQKITNDLCLLSGGAWSSTSGAGAWCVGWNNSRGNSRNYVGLRLACYPA